MTNVMRAQSIWWNNTLIFTVLSFTVLGTMTCFNIMGRIINMISIVDILGFWKCELFTIIWDVVGWTKSASVAHEITT
jgi:hypothetical protein